MDVHAAYIIYTYPKETWNHQDSGTHSSASSESDLVMDGYGSIWLIHNNRMVSYETHLNTAITTGNWLIWPWTDRPKSVATGGASAQRDAVTRRCPDGPQLPGEIFGRGVLFSSQLRIEKEHVVGHSLSYSSNGCGSSLRKSASLILRLKMYV